MNILQDLPQHTLQKPLPKFNLMPGYHGRPCVCLTKNLFFTQMIYKPYGKYCNLQRHLINTTRGPSSLGGYYSSPSLIAVDWSPC
jgi:hypothetical protein